MVMAEEKTGARSLLAARSSSGKERDYFRSKTERSGFIVVLN
jgi:hypothetical protein